jgi:hypothetical protein
MRRISISRLTACLCLTVLLSLGWHPQNDIRAQTDEYCYHLHRDVSTPLNDLRNQVYIRMDGQNTGFTGGLYPGGSNVRPSAHEAAGVEIAGQVMPLNANGIPDPNGRIVMIGIGMSNAYQEFGAFLTMVESDPTINPALTIVNGAIPSQTAEYWIDPNADAWVAVNQRLAANGVTPQQVQIAWVKNTRTGSSAFPANAQLLQSDFKAIARNLKINYPNIKIAYFSSRTHSYIYWSGLSPEPDAFETGFSVKWLIESQINGDPELNYDPANGPVVAPYLSWSAYLWANGPNPRSDGLVWLQEDLLVDCTHPSPNGELKVAQLLMNFFKNDTTTGWFRMDTASLDVTINQAPDQADPTKASTIAYQAIFSKPVGDFTNGDVALSGTAGPTTAIVTGSGTTYTISVSGMAGDGMVIAAIPAGVAHDSHGNANRASTSTDDTVTFDATRPDVTIDQALSQADPTYLSPILFQAVFSEPVSDFTGADVRLAGTAGATNATVTGSGAIYTISVSGMANDGTVIATIPAGIAHDAAGNASTASTSSDNTVLYRLPYRLFLPLVVQH